MVGRFPQMLSLAVLVLFVHAIFQQIIISNMREELHLVLLERSEVFTRRTGSGRLDDSFLILKSPPALPSIFQSGISDKKVNEKREIYGGKNDALHLGGFTEIDPMGISENLWNFMFGPLAIKSIIDVTISSDILLLTHSPRMDFQIIHFAYVNRLVVAEVILLVTSVSKEPKFSA